MRILVIFTGGTIGSAVKEGWISPYGEARRHLIEAYEASGRRDVEFVAREPYTILSEHLCAEKLNILTQSVSSALDEGFDGIIVTHGTDTLQYSAAALDLALGSETVPVMLVSSNYPLSSQKANGHANFAAAVEFIRERAGRGVFISYRNSDGEVYFHRGGRAVAHREADDDVFSLEGKYYARLTDNGIKVIGAEVKSEALGAFKLTDDSRILVIDAYPGASYAHSLEDYSAVILRPYHSGTLDTSNGRFCELCSRAKRLGIPVFAVNVKGGVTYESSKKFESLGIIPADTALAHAYMRLWIALSRGEHICAELLD